MHGGQKCAETLGIIRTHVTSRFSGFSSGATKLDLAGQRFLALVSVLRQA